MRVRSGASDGIGDDRRLEALERLVALAERQQRFAAADQRRHVPRIGDNARSKCSDGALVILLGEPDVAEPGFGRIEVRRQLQRRLEVALRRLQIAGLQPQPARLMALERRRRAEAWHGGRET